jgi:predicted transcriptional regulator
VTDIKLVVGQSARADGDAFVDAWSRAERGDFFEDHALTFQSWDALAAVMSAERLSLLRHVHAHPEISIEALAGSLGRQNRAIEQDVSALARAGLLKVHGGLVDKTVDRIQAVIAFD